MILFFRLWRRRFQQVVLAINERPKADGIVRLGVAITEKGTYTLSLKEAIATDLKLVDKVTGSVYDLATSNYEFEA